MSTTKSFNTSKNQKGTDLSSHKSVVSKAYSDGERVYGDTRDQSKELPNDKENDIENPRSKFFNTENIKEINITKDLAEPKSLELTGKQVTKIMNIFKPQLREKALAYIFKNKEKIPDLAKLLWNIPGMIAIFIQEVIKMYSILGIKDIKKEELLKYYNLISLFQILALDDEIKYKAIKGM